MFPDYAWPHVFVGLSLWSPKKGKDVILVYFNTYT